jgi:Tfp pilus tip-associated adhesin PilY1
MTVVPENTDNSMALIRSNWNLSVDFYGGRKTGEPGKKPSWQGREPTTHMKYPSRKLNPRPTGTTAARGERMTATPPMPPIISLPLIMNELGTIF